ncbi:MAG TPA: metalloregulator ArsR/SmtB family transcription factor [Spirochaetota bacterium]|nr:metalloregulator ArsR/SmtB family transcription factor [Spirochaetota bacterium]HPC42330.1 metalloregulator ArsR/SmtB family transcription factor [Spirochaetota bacterium]HPL17856.1 metalloregulator ArsR/SmtB family transcription factor [Spirochaetota bacterium]HQF10221.1 metalloregulator ArsR/SmtB family transcription factor [Spirochaetota bacterium]HQH99367.1 metalloregulator ArsR/SmtB family transcription factor [Spirochaetota bacterium]
MEQKIQPQYGARAVILKAMGHPTRLFILEELNKQERCVNELTEMIGSDVSTVSKHLSVLKNAGLVYDDKRGNSIYYRLCCSCILDIVNSVQTVIKTKVEKQMEIAQCCGITRK